jgi:hypothetical protein
MPWHEIATDVNVPIYITEGEFKAAAACALVGLACLGLGGVDQWRATKRGIEILPTLKEIKWDNRKVVVIYDSDAATNANVVRAQKKLAEMLTALGAVPQIASLPGGPEGEKLGLDDYIVKYGKDALLEILQEAENFAEAQALWDLNSEVVYVKDPGLVIERDTGLRMMPNGFVNHAYANRHYMSQELTKNGPILKKKKLAARWLEWERRFELQKITYQPGEPHINGDTWNTWPGWGLAPKKGDIKPWEWLLKFLFQGAEGAMRWFEQWLAYPLQNPGAKHFTSVVLWGLEKGTGKTLIAYTMMRIYGRNSIEIKNRDLRGNFNGWAENRQFVYGDEITGGDKRVDADWLKGLITQDTMRINAKYLPEYTIPDCINYFFTSNHPDAFFIEDNDRRFFVHEVRSKPADRSFYDVYDKWYKGDGASALFDHLLHLNLSKFNPREHAFITPSKEEMIRAGRSDVAAFCMELKEDPTRVLAPLGEKIAKGCDLFSPSQIHVVYDPNNKGRVTIPGIGRELKRSGFIQVNNATPVRTQLGLQRLYAIRNEEKWQKARPHELAEHYEKFFGVPARGRKFS